MAFYSLLLRLVHFLIYTRLWLLSWIRWFGTAQFRISKSKFSIDDGRRLVKLPVHLAIQLKENDLSWDDIASMVVWSSAVGITYITLFDSEGLLKKDSKRLSSAIDRRKVELLGSELSQRVSIKLSMLLAQNGKSCHITHVRLASLDDGRPVIISGAQQLCTAVANHQLGVDRIDVGHVQSLLTGGSEVPDPDLLISCGPTSSLCGFLPWQIRLTEILFLPTHSGISYGKFLHLLRVYAGTEQRFGV